ncbi:MAG TPA: hypothetical protein VN648_11490 [Candidatus Methylomirabilis sp.]|nr:hypothetical protein [Candidatus Methylomirabilis sp.]
MGNLLKEVRKPTGWTSATGAMTGSPGFLATSSRPVDGLAVLADVLPVSTPQFAEDAGGQNGQSAEEEERLVDAMDHLGGVGPYPRGEEERGGQGGDCDTEA